MNPSQRPRKKRQGWLPLLCVTLVLVIGGWFLWRQVLYTVFSRPPQATTSAPAPEPAAANTTQAAPPKAAPAGDSPQIGKARQPIFDRNMGALAVSFKQASVYLRPIELQGGEKAVDHLAEILGLPVEKLQTDIRTERSFVWLKRNLSAETAQKIAEAHYSGVYLVDELQRYYPLHDHAAHVVGFVKDDQGLAGAEFLYDTILSGDRVLSPQYLNLPGIEARDVPPNGAAPVLTLDIDLQVILEKKLQHLLLQTSAKSASAVLIEAGSGEILAMANLPTYDPNIYWKAAATSHQNKILSEPVPMAGLNAFFKGAAELAAGNLPPEMAEREAEAERIISPRAMKIARGDVAMPATQESQVWQPGIHLSPPFQWPLAFTQKDEVLSSFCAKLGLAAAGAGLADSAAPAPAGQGEKKGACNLDDSATTTPPLSLLAAFAQLTNGGKAVSPHLLRGIWRMDNNTFHPTKLPTVEALGPQASANFVRFVEGLLPPGPDDDLVIETIRSTAKAKKAVSEQIMVNEEEPVRTIGDAIRFSAMTLGVGRRGDHQLAIMIMADGAKVDLTLPSPFRKAAAEVITQAHGLMAKRWTNEIKAPQLESPAVLYQKWSKSQALDKAPATIDSMVNLEMPDLIGLSLRKAMQALHGYNLKITIQGAGRVTRQSPAAGVRLKGVTEAKLELHMDN